MYLTIRQQVKHLSKEDYRSIKELCHIAKNLTNQAIYNIRQHYFAEGKYLNYEKNYTLLKSSDNWILHRAVHQITVLQTILLMAAVTDLMIMTMVPPMDIMQTEHL